MSDQVEVVIKFTISKKDAAKFSSMAIERVINTSVRLIESYVDQIDELHDHVDGEDINVNLEDWKECKPVVINLWSGLLDALFRVSCQMERKATAWPLRMGDRY